MGEVLNELFRGGGNRRGSVTISGQRSHRAVVQYYGYPEGNMLFPATDIDASNRLIHVPGPMVVSGRVTGADDHTHGPSVISLADEPNGLGLLYGGAWLNFIFVLDSANGVMPYFVRLNGGLSIGSDDWINYTWDIVGLATEIEPDKFVLKLANIFGRSERFDGSPGHQFQITLDLTADPADWVTEREAEKKGPLPVKFPDNTHPLNP